MNEAGSSDVPQPSTSSGPLPSVEEVSNFVKETLENNNYQVSLSKKDIRIIVTTVYCWDRADSGVYFKLIDSLEDLIPLLKQWRGKLMTKPPRDKRLRNRWTPTLNPKANKIFIFIIDLGQLHWVTLIIHFNEQFLGYFVDPLGQNLPKRLKQILTGITVETFDVKHCSKNFDCGLFAIENAVNISTMLRCPSQFAKCSEPLAELNEDTLIIKRIQFATLISKSKNYKEPKSTILPTLEKPPSVKPTEDKIETNSEEYLYLKKAGTSGISGQHYETKLLTLLLCKALNDQNITSFHLGTNADGIGEFDDIIFRYCLNGEEKIVFIQAKHREDSHKNKVTVEKLMDTTGDFSLTKYFGTFRKILEKFDEKSDDPIYKGDAEKLPIEFIIFTNAEADIAKQISVEEFSSNPNDFFLASSKGKMFRFKGDAIQYLNNVKESALESQARELAECFAKYILVPKPNLANMMSDEFIKRYHVFLAQQVLKVWYEGNKLQGKFREEFFNNPDKLVSIFRDALYNEAIEKYPMKPKKPGLSDSNVLALIEEFLTEQHADQLSRLIGSVIQVKADKSCCFIEQCQNENLLDRLKQVKLNDQTIKNSLAIAGKNRLINLCFQLKDTFGNIDWTVKNDRRITYLANILLERLKNSNDDKIVNIDNNFSLNDLKVNGGLGGLLGNLLVLDDREKNLIKFNNNLEQLPENSKIFYEKLRNEIPEESLQQFRFKIISNDFPRISIDFFDDSQLRSFFEKFKLYTNQDSEKGIENIIKDQLKKYYTFDRKRSSFAFRIKYDAMFIKVHDDVQKWWMQPKKAPYLTKLNCTYFQTASETFFESPLLEILRYVYINQFENNAFKFNSTAFESLQLNEFLKKTDNVVWNVVTDHYDLTARKMVQHFAESNFIDFDYFIREHYKIIDELDKSEPTEQSILVIGCKRNINDDDEKLEMLLELIENCKYTKIILITGKKLPPNIEESLSPKFSYCEKCDQSCSLADLIPEHQEELLKSSKICFQGTDMTLEKIISDESWYSLVDATSLSKLMNRTRLEIGRTPTSFDEVKDYYVQQGLCQILIDKRCIATQFSDLFVISNVKDKTLLQRLGGRHIINHDNIDNLNMVEKKKICVIDNINAQENYTQLSNFLSGRSSHWLELSSNQDELVWRESKGSLSNLRPFITNKFYKEVIKPIKLFSNSDDNKNAIVISAGPGMGKSTVLKYLEKNLKNEYPFWWVVRINLIDHSAKLKQADFDAGDDKIFDFLMAAADIECSFQRNLFKKSLESERKVCLLFDGFDEINPNYKHPVLKMLKVLKEHYKLGMICITTRPFHFQEELEDALTVYAYELKPFTTEDDKEFLTKFWTLKDQKVDKARFDLFIAECMLKFEQLIGETKWNRMEKFMSIPLHVMMIADRLKDTFTSFCRSESNELSESERKQLSKKFNLLDLYGDFIRKKYFQIYYEEKNKEDLSKVALLEGAEQRFPIFLEEHRKLALYSLIKGDEECILLTELEIDEIQNIIQEINRGKRNIGVVKNISDGIPIFAHITFAEYLAAGHLNERFKSTSIDNFSKDFLKQLIRWEQVCVFFELYLQNDLKNQVKIPDKTEKLRRLLQMLIEGKANVLWSIFENYIATNEIEDCYMKSQLQNIEIDVQNKLLCFFAEKGYTKLVNTLLGDLDSFNIVYKSLEGSPMWLAAERGHLDILRILFDKLSCNKLHWLTGKWLNTELRSTYDLDVLESILKIDSIGVYYLGESEDTSLLLKSLHANAPEHVVRMLVQKTTIDWINENYAGTLIAKSLYDYSGDMLRLLVAKGMLLNNYKYEDEGILCTICYEFITSSTPIPYNYSAFFKTEAQFKNFYCYLKDLLKIGAAYHPKASQYIAQTYYIQKLIIELLRVVTEENISLNRLLNNLVDRVVVGILSIDEKSNTIIVNDSERKMGIKIKNGIEIFFLPDYLKPLIFHNNTSEIVYDTLREVKNILKEHHQEIDEIYFHKKGLRNLLDRSYISKYKHFAFTSLLERIIALHQKQGYEINEAFSDVQCEINDSLAKLQNFANIIQLNDSNRRRYWNYFKVSKRDQLGSCEFILAQILKNDGIKPLTNCLKVLKNMGRKHRLRELQRIERISEYTNKPWELLMFIEDLFSATNVKPNLVESILKNADNEFISIALKTCILENGFELKLPDIASNQLNQDLITIFNKYDTDLKLEHTVHSG